MNERAPKITALRHDRIAENRYAHLLDEQGRFTEATTMFTGRIDVGRRQRPVLHG